MNLSETRFVVTGPTGWLGRSLIAWLAGRIGTNWRTNITVFATSERQIYFDNDAFQARALDSISKEDVDGAYVIHFAFLGGEQVALMPAEEFLRQNIQIDAYLISALSAASPRGVFVASSGVASQGVAGSHSLYSASKIAQETRFLDYAGATCVRTMVGRIFNVAGPYINKLENYALSSFVLQAFRHRAIRISANVPVFRSYLHVFDLAEIIIRELIGHNDFPKHAMEICGPLLTEMQDVAAAVATVLGLPLSAIDRPPINYAQPNAYLGDPTIVRSIALRHSMKLRTLNEQVADTAEYLQKTHGLTIKL